MIYDNNFLSQQKILEIESKILSPGFPWYLNPASAPHGYDGVEHQTIRDGMGDDIQFVHDVYLNRRPYSDFYDLSMNIFDQFCKKNEIIVRALLRAKINLTVSSNKKNVAPAHVDYVDDHKVFIYYINDSDGDTIIYDQKYNGNNPLPLKVKEKITPKAGSAVVFNGLNYHSPSLPFLSRKRAVINICFV